MGTIANTDAELVAASRRGELNAFGELVARYQEIVCAVSYGSTGDRALSEDVAQETFVAAWGALHRVRDGSLRPWLCAIARNLGRKARRRTRREESIEVDEQLVAESNPFDELARSDSERIVRDALARLPAKDREVLVLYYCEDQSIRDVAQTLRIGESAAMQRLSRARRHLADGVTELVERSLRGSHPRRDLVAAVLATIAAVVIPTRVEASSLQKGSTMLKVAFVSASLVAAGTTAYLVHRSAVPSRPTAVATPSLHCGSGAPRRPALGPSAPVHPVAARVATLADLAFLPADAQIVVGADMAKIQTSFVWKALVAPMLASSPALSQFQTDCGLDPLASLSSVTIGLGRTGDDGHADASIVMHGFSRAKLFDCIELLDHKLGSDALPVEVDEGVMLMKGADSQLALTFLDETTALAVLGTGATRAGIATIASQRGHSTRSGYAELIGEVNTDDAIWLAVRDGSQILTVIDDELASASTTEVHGVYASIDLAEGLTVSAGARVGSPALVTALVEEVRKRMAELGLETKLGSSFDQLDVIADEGDIIVSAALSQSQLVSAFAGLETSSEPD